MSNAATEKERKRQYHDYLERQMQEKLRKKELDKMVQQRDLAALGKNLNDI